MHRQNDEVFLISIT